MPLSSLARHFPVFNKKEEILATLCEYDVPMSRALWFIKTTAAYYNALWQDRQRRSRPTTDPAIEWFEHISRSLRDTLSKLREWCVGRVNVRASTSSTRRYISPSRQATPEVQAMTRKWQYMVRLARHAHEEGLLDRQAFFEWMLDMLADRYI